MPLRTPLRNMASACARRPAMISQAQPMAMLMSSTYLRVCSVYEWVASAATQHRPERAHGQRPPVVRLRVQTHALLPEAQVQHLAHTAAGALSTSSVRLLPKSSQLAASRPAQVLAAWCL